MQHPYRVPADARAQKQKAKIGKDKVGAGKCKDCATGNIGRFQSQPVRHGHGPLARRHAQTHDCPRDSPCAQLNVYMSVSTHLAELLPNLDGFRPHLGRRIARLPVRAKHGIRHHQQAIIDCRHTYIQTDRWADGHDHVKENSARSGGRIYRGDCDDPSSTGPGGTDAPRCRQFCCDHHDDNDDHDDKRLTAVHHVMRIVLIAVGKGARVAAVCA